MRPFFLFSLLVLGYVLCSAGRKLPSGTRKSFPTVPSGATLVHLAPDANTKATIPMLVNREYKKHQASSATHAIVVIHGQGRDFDNAWREVHDVVGDQVVLVAPAFYVTDDGSASNWYNPKKNLAWTRHDNDDAFADWIDGADAVAPASGTHALKGAQVSSYDVLDAILQHLMQKVPKLNKVTFAGHSGGAATVHRYSILADRHPQGVHVRYVAANSPSGVYFTPDRPNKVDQNDCPRWDTWRYGIHGGPRYVSQKISNGAALSKRWFMRDVIRLVGTADTYHPGDPGDQSCMVHAQGGYNRADRNYAAWVYENLLAGTDVDLSKFYGYKNLHALHGGVKNDRGSAKKTFKHKLGIAAGVAHDGARMWSSDVGRKALLE